MNSHKLTDNIIKRSEDTDNKNSSRNNDLPGLLDFAISDKLKSLGIICVAREGNTIVIKITDGGSDQEPFVIRRAINFKDWNIFIRDLRKNIFDNLRCEIPDPKHLNRIIANVETVLNKNFEYLRTINKSPSHTDDNYHDSGGNSTTISENASSVSIPFITINQLVRKQRGTFNSTAAVVSITPIMQAISSVKWECTNENATDFYGNPVCSKPNNEIAFETPLVRLDGLKLRCSSCSTQAPDIAESNVQKEWVNYVIIQVQDSDSPSIDDLQKMTGFVYDEYAGHVHIGETIHIWEC